MITNAGIFAPATEPFSGSPVTIVTTKRRGDVISKLQVLVLVAVLGGAFIFAGIIIWPVFSALWTSGDGSLVPALVMIAGCFVVGGALMYLLFRSARSGRDEEVYRATQEREETNDWNP